jgi:hypothetical protein
MYRMRKTAIGLPPKGYSVGKKSKVVYSDTDESDNELVPVFIIKTRHKPNVKKTTSVIHSETSATEEYAKRGINILAAKKKTRRSRKSRRQTKRRRAKK